MCGFVGQLVFRDARDRGADVHTLQDLTALGARRGPDDMGLFSDGDWYAVGFRRLAILDPSPAGHQPMRSADGRYVLAYNGALYNFRALRDELQRAGARIHSTGDTAVVLTALATWGAEALERFNGMFALAFYDTATRRLLLARDHAGMKPLYYLESPYGIAFASQFDQIVHHPWGQRAARSMDALGLYVRLGYVPAPYSLLRDAHLIEAGTWLTIDVDGRAAHGRSFTFPVHRTPDLQGADAVDAVEETVAAAVRRHLVADVPVGVLLSGGIDSPLIAATAYGAPDAPICAFTLGTGGDGFDESADAVAYARELGMEHIVTHLTPAGAVDLVDDVMAACTEPLADVSIFPMLAVSGRARDRVKVVLSGDGGDELFWGYVDRFSAVLHRLEAPGDSAPAALTLERLLGSGADPRWPRTIGDLQRIVHSRGSEGWWQRVFPDLPAWPRTFSLFDYDGRDADRTAQWLRWSAYTGPLAMILQKVDRASMFHGLEARAPLLDRELIDVALRIDWRSCLDARRRIGKLPLRGALARRLRHQTSGKRGFTVPMDEWFRGPLRALLADVVLCRTEIGGLAVDPTAIHDLFDRHQARRADHAWQLWVLLSLCLWEQRHDDAGSSWKRAAPGA